MTLFLAKLIWGLGVLGWFASRFRHQQRSRKTPKLRRVFLSGLAEVEVMSQRQTGQPFSGLDAGGQESLLRAIEEAQPAFFAALVEHAYRGYYTHPQVHAAIGYPGRAPQPLGHQLAPFREELLQLQRGRQPFWRSTPS